MPRFACRSFVCWAVYMKAIRSHGTDCPAHLTAQVPERYRQHISLGIYMAGRSWASSDNVGVGTQGPRASFLAGGLTQSRPYRIPHTVPLGDSLSHLFIQQSSQSCHHTLHRRDISAREEALTTYEFPPSHMTDMGSKRNSR